MYFITNLFRFPAYWIIGIVFFLFRKIILKRYGDTFFSDEYGRSRDRLISYIQCCLSMHLIICIVELIVSMASGKSHNVWYEDVVAMVIWGIVAISLILCLLMKACHFDVLLVAAVMYIFYPIVLPLALVGKLMPLPSPSFSDDSESITETKIREGVESIEKTIKDEVAYRHRRW